MFDEMDHEDLILAFFPCTRFCQNSQLLTSGRAYQQTGWSDEKKLIYGMSFVDEMCANYKRLSKMVCVCIRHGLRLVIENPYTDPHFLKMYFPISPTIIDRDRRDNGDYYKKPTQFWFIGFQPYDNLVFEALDYVYRPVIERVRGKNRTAMRSEISPQYARRFIKRYLVNEE